MLKRYPTLAMLLAPDAPAAATPATPATPAAPATPATPPATPAADTWDDGQPFDAAKARGLIDKLRDENKTLKPLADKAKELEDANKSELEKAQGKATTAEANASVQTLRADRAEVALEKGLTLAQAKRLQGSNRAELETDADAMMTELGITPKGDGGKGDEGKGPPGQRPREVTRTGTVPGSTEVETDPAKIAASIPRSRY